MANTTVLGLYSNSSSLDSFSYSSSALPHPHCSPPHHSHHHHHSLVPPPHHHYHLHHSQTVMEIVKANSKAKAKAIAMVEPADTLVEHLRHSWTSPYVELSFCSQSPLQHRSHYPLDHRHRELDIYHHQHPSSVSFSPCHHHGARESEYAYE